MHSLSPMRHGVPPTSCPFNAARGRHHEGSRDRRSGAGAVAAVSFVDAVSEVSRWFNRNLFGGANETVSSRLGKLEVQGVWWARVCCALIAAVLFDPGHCHEAREEPRE